MKGYILLGILAFLLISSCVPKAEEGTVRIGVILPQTGAVAALGELGRDGALLAVEDLSAEGKKVELILEDDKSCDTKTALSAAKKLQDIDNVDAIISGCGESTEAAAAHTENLLIITPNVKVGNLEDDPTVFGLYPSVSTQMAKLSDYVYNVDDIKKVSVMYSGDWGFSFANSFKEDYEGTVDLIEPYDYLQTDFRINLLKMQDKGSEGLVIFGSNLHLIAKQLKELCLDIPIYTNFAGEDPTYIIEMPDVVDGVKYSYPFDYKSAASQEFIGRFIERYGFPPAPISTAAYDAVNLAFDAVTACGNNYQCQSDYLYSLEDYEGVSGGISFMQDGSNAGEAYMKIIRDGSFQYIEA